jgi:Golgi phosphoprotein 3 (GPP34)
MPQLPVPDPLASLGPDLVLLSVRPRDGKLLAGRRLEFGLAASELARLAALGRITVTRDQMTVRDPAPTGHPELDAALAALAQGWPPPRPATWLSLPRAGLRDDYLDRMVAARILAERPPGVLRTAIVRSAVVSAAVPGAAARRSWPGARGRRFAVLAPAEAADARSRLDALARPGREDRSGEAAPDPGQLALGGLAAAIGLPRFLYPGRAARPERDRLTRIATRIAPARNGRPLPAPPAPPAPAEPASPAAASAMYAISWAALLAASNQTPRSRGGSLSTWSAIRPQDTTSGRSQ